MSTASAYAEKVYRDALALGIPEPQARLAAAQSSLETGYGKSAPGGAYFGIKAGSSWNGPTVTFGTHEYVDGKRVSTSDAFRSYASPSESLKDWWTTLQAKWPDAAAAPTFQQAVAGLDTGVHGAYATDPNYKTSIANIGAKYVPAGSALDAINSAAPTGSQFATAYAPTPAALPSFRAPPIPAGMPTMNRSGTASPQPIRLPNGSVVTPGRPIVGSDGSITTFDANGNRTHVPPPLVNIGAELAKQPDASGHYPTILSGLANKYGADFLNQGKAAVQQGLASAGSTVSNGLNTAGSAALDIASSLPTKVAGLGSSLTGLFSGGFPSLPSAPKPPAPLPVTRPVVNSASSIVNNYTAGAYPSGQVAAPPPSGPLGGYLAGDYGYTPVSYAPPPLPAPAPLAPLKQVTVAPTPVQRPIDPPDISALIGNALRSGGYSVTGNNKGFVAKSGSGFSPGALIPTKTISGGIPNYLKGL